MSDAEPSRPVAAYGDHAGDGIVQLNFTLPVPDGPMGQRAARALAQRMGLTHAEVVHARRLLDDYTHFVIYARCPHAVDVTQLACSDDERRPRSREELERLLERGLGRRAVVVGASTGSDTHSVGIDAILNLKGFGGEHGLEGYRCFEVHNLGSQVANESLLARAVEVGADALLVSQTVTQQDLHLHNLTALVELVEAEGLRERLVLVCGGPRITSDLAKELGFDAGFARGATAREVADFLAIEVLDRIGAA